MNLLCDYYIQYIIHKQLRNAHKDNEYCLCYIVLQNIMSNKQSSTNYRKSLGRIFKVITGRHKVTVWSLVTLLVCIGILFTLTILAISQLTSNKANPNTPTKNDSSHVDLQNGLPSARIQSISPDNITITQNNKEIVIQVTKNTQIRTTKNSLLTVSQLKKNDRVIVTVTAKDSALVARTILVQY